MFRIFVSAVIVATALTAQPAGNGIIGGIVVDHGSGHPVRKAVVTVMWEQTPPAWAAVQTDGSGRFRVSGLPPASYIVGAVKDGVGHGSHGDNPSVPGQSIKLAAGEQRLDLVIRLVRPIVVSGVVTDSDGEPLAGAEVQLGRESWRRGKQEVVPLNQARTNDRGEYRMVCPSPGRFYLSAGSHEQRLPFGAAGEAPPAFGRQFYGGGDDWRNAKPVIMKSGQELKGIDFRLPIERTTIVRGRVTNMPPMPQPGPNGTMPPGGWPHVMLQVFRADGLPSYHFGAGVNPTDGTFQSAGLPPGKYVLQAMLQGPKPLWAMQTVEVHGGNLDGVELTLAPPVSLKGRVATKGTSFASMAQLTVELTPPIGRPGFGKMSVKPAPDGTFTFEQVPPGIWDIGVRPLPPGAFIQSMRLGEQDVLTEEMEIALNPPGALQILLNSQGGTVSGELEDEARKTRTVVLLAPESKFRHVMSFYAMAAVAEGKFEMKGVTPGKYRVIALEALSTGFDYRNPDFLDRFAEDAVTVEVAEGATAKASPKVIRAARIQEVLAQ